MAKILIVDDCTDSSESMAKFLEKAGHEVICVEDGKGALYHVLGHKPDVILLDLIMPDMDGPSFLEVVRSYLRFHSLPVVVLTGLADSPLSERIQYLKVNSVLIKGKASREDVLHALEEALVRVPG